MYAEGPIVPALLLGPCPIDPDRIVDITSFRLAAEPEKEVARFSNVPVEAAPGGNADESVRGRETVESTDFRPDSRLWAIAAKPESEFVGVVGEA